MSDVSILLSIIFGAFATTLLFGYLGKLGARIAQEKRNREYVRRQMSQPRSFGRYC